ncbi:hypothetical protein [Pannonibacter phragmitetus]|uniref:hypothetical protein n=1 Tax=Pannonibacter phragmitetus TaxID=121719 RepID=UPI003D2ECC63
MPSVLRRPAVLLLISSSAGLLGFSALLLLLAISSGIGSVRSIVLEAQATGMVVRFSGQSNDWAFSDVVVCVPRAKIERAAERGTGQCDARRYVESNEEDFRINWSAGSSAQVTSPSPGVLVLDITGQARMLDRTRVIVNRESWLAAGALTFSGIVQIGDQLASGETKMILNGSFDIREQPFWSQNTEVLKRGSIWRGESVSIVSLADGAAGSVEVFGHITPLDTGKPGFAVGVVSSPGDVLLQLGFFGAQEPVQVAPTWMDRALTSPLILALAVILSVVLSVGQLAGNAVSSLLSLRGQDEGAEADAPDPSQSQDTAAAESDAVVAEGAPVTMANAAPSSALQDETPGSQSLAR